MTLWATKGSGRTCDPHPGKLIYRGVNINEIVEEAYRNDRFVFEEVIWLLLFGSLPTQEQLDDFCEILAEHRALPEGFMDTMNAPPQHYE